VTKNSKNGENNLNNLTQSAYETIKEKIVDGELKQGQIFSISAMSKKLKISRTPVTYACQKLENDKFLTIVPKQGVIINTLSINDAREIYELRAAIESYSAKHAYPKMNKNDIAYLEKSYKEQVDAVEKNDITKFMAADTAFHKYLLSKYENSHFAKVIDNLLDRAFLLGVESCKNPTRLKTSLKEHRRIIDCLKNKDKNLFVEAVEKNILNGYSSLTGNYIS
jgi:DNA-binding GntR family transcriptional regulator